MPVPTEAPVPLIVVVPVFNEQSSIVEVLTEWRKMLGGEVENFRLLVIDDGSTDDTPVRLTALNWPELHVHRHENRGHGQSCLVGYQLAAKMGTEYVFQIDSDGQCDPGEFPKIWQQRGKKPAIYGRRKSRDDGPARRLISLVLRLTLKAKRSTKLNDSNVPFRLYYAQLAADTALRVPRTFDLANIGMALLMEPAGFLELPIHFRDRMGGHPSVRWWGFGRKAMRLMKDLETLPDAG